MIYTSLIVVLIFHLSAIRATPSYACNPPSEGACTKCDLTRNPNRYVADPCSCGYYQCINDQFGGFKLQSMLCPRCTCWDQEKLTCVRDLGSTDTTCVTQQIKEDKTISGNTCTTTGPDYVAKFELIPGDEGSYYMYVVGRKIKMPCPAGTHFSLTDCLCILGGHTNEPDPFMCLTFDGDDAFANPNGVYVNPKDVSISDNGKVDKAAYFNGASSNIEVPAFSNKESPKMSLSLWYKRELTSSPGVEALISNDDCATGSDPSIQVLSTNYSKVLGGFRAGVETTKISSTQNLTDNGANKWNHIALVYDGSKITLFLNGAEQNTRQANGFIKAVHCPLLIGSMYGKNYFQGYMDQICFYSYALHTKQVMNLYHTPNEVMHPSSTISLISGEEVVI